MIECSSQFKARRAVTLSWLAALVACGGDDPAMMPVGTNTPAVQQKAHTVSGVAQSAAGMPLVSVAVEILGTTLAGEHAAFYPKTDDMGTYSMKVPAGIYTVAAYHDFTSNGGRYRMRLHPSDGRTDSRESAPGIVANFVWKLEGVRPGSERATDQAHAYYGAEVKASIDDVRSESFQTNIYRSEFPQGFTATLTLTPEGPLADGSTGGPLMFTKQVTSQTDTYFGGMNVPLGRYKASATATKPGGAPTVLKIRGASAVAGANTGAPTETTVFDFVPETGATGGIRPIWISLVYGPPYPPL